MSWLDDARRAADEHLTAQQEADEQRAEQTCDYLVRLAEQLGAAPTRGTARLGWGPQVNGTTVSLALPHQVARNEDRRGLPRAQLRAEVTGNKPEAHLWLGVDWLVDGDWLDAGPVETITDVGLAMADPTAYSQQQAQAAGDDGEQGVGDMLQMVLEGIVRDVVVDVLDGRLGDGQA